MLNVIFLLILTFFTTKSLADTKPVIAELNPLRTVKIMGTIGEDAGSQADRILTLASKGMELEPINVIINSGGGMVSKGGQIIAAIRAAQLRGYQVNCYVTHKAASMGFQILSTCLKRFAFKYAILLWHPMKIGLEGNQGSENLLYEGKRLKAWEAPFIEDLLQALKIKRNVFEYHRFYETYWLAFEFNKLSPGFLTVVDDIRGVDDLFVSDTKSLFP